MTNEIKEIIDDMKEVGLYSNARGFIRELDSRDCNLLLDYITNLQEIEKEHQKINGELRQEINNLQQRIDKAVEYIYKIFDFSFFKEECPLNFGFGDENEEKSQNVFYEDDYCEKNCNDEYKKCWLKYFERLQELKEEGK